jgi:hypothetical protein
MRCTFRQQIVLAIDHRRPSLESCLPMAGVGLMWLSVGGLMEQSTSEAENQLRIFNCRRQYEWRKEEDAVRPLNSWPSLPAGRRGFTALDSTFGRQVFGSFPSSVEHPDRSVRGTSRPLRRGKKNNKYCLRQECVYRCRLGTNNDQY